MCTKLLFYGLVFNLAAIKPNFWKLINFFDQSKACDGGGDGEKNKKKGIKSGQLDVLCSTVSVIMVFHSKLV